MFVEMMSSVGYNFPPYDYLVFQAVKLGLWATVVVSSLGTLIGTMVIQEPFSWFLILGLVVTL